MIAEQTCVCFAKWGGGLRNYHQAGLLECTLALSARPLHEYGEL